MDLGDTEGTIALRVPDHELARDILRRTGPMAVSSANISGHPAALTCDEAIEQLGDSVSVYLDGGPLGGAGGAPSTIVDFTQDEHGRCCDAVESAWRRCARPRRIFAICTDEAEVPGEEGPSADSESVGEGSAPRVDGSARTDEPAAGG